MSEARLPDDAIVIVGMGAQTPLGQDAISSAAAVRAGLCALAEHPFMIDKYGEPMVVARADWLDEAMPVGQRIASMASAAMAEALGAAQAKASLVQGQVTLHLATSADNGGAESQRSVLAAGCVECLRRQGITAQPNWTIEGHAAGLAALGSAIGALRAGSAALAVIVAADSWLDPHRLESIDRADRLHSINQTWGFSPGEAACCCVLARAEVARRLGLQPLAQVLATSIASETKLMGTRTVCVGEGLTAAFRGALSPDRKVGHSYCDFNGETYRADEYGFAVCRTGESFHDAGSFTAAAQNWGDTGAVSGLLGLMLAIADWREGVGGVETSLSWCSSAALPLRAAAVLGKVDTLAGGAS